MKAHLKYHIMEICFNG